MSVLPQSKIKRIGVDKGRLIALNVALLLGWVWLFRPIMPYLKTIITREDFRSNQIALVMVVALIVYKAIDEQWRIDLGQQATMRVLPLLLCVIGASGFVINERYLDINTISTILFVLASYGLSGLYLDHQTWRNGLPVAFLIAGIIPLNHHLQTFVGYPMRIVSATLVRDLFAGLGYQSLGVDTILVFESGVAHIDIPCSGAKSLWTGAMFLTTATWLEQKRLDWRWLTTAIVMVILLFLSNLLRITLLVLSGQVLGMPLLAEMLHLPLGIIGFVATCLVALWLLRHWVPMAQRTRRPSEQRVGISAETRPWQLGLGLLLGVLLLSSFHQPYVRANPTIVTTSRSFPATFTTAVQPLEQAQLDWLLADGAEQADRYRFDYATLSGSMMMVTASNWHAHHFPEGCFAGLGIETQATTTAFVSADFPVRWLTLSRADGSVTNAVYWFQSAEKITDDYASRIWDDLRFKRNQWVLVSAVFDAPIDFDSAETQALLTDLHNTIASD